jgi:hypothetical protein
MSQIATLLGLVQKHPGMTACGYTRLLCKQPNRFKSATVLGQLHTLAERGDIQQKQIQGKRWLAWHFFPV